jgi:hypothetical protein
MAEPLADPEEVRAHLVAAAKAGVALTYGELLEHLGYRFAAEDAAALRNARRIDRDAEMRGEPELAVLVVRASDGTFPARAGGSAVEEKLAAIRGCGKGPRRRA